MTGPHPLDADHEKRPLRIVHILRQPLGGLFRHVCDLAAGQAALGHKVGIISGIAEGPVATAMMAELAKNASLGVHQIHVSRLPGIGDLWTMGQINGLVTNMSPDVVHGHGAKGGAYARLLPRRKHYARFYTPHGGSLHYSPRSLQGRVYLAMERHLLRRTDGLLFESEFGRKTFEEKVAPVNVSHTVVHNGVTLSEFNIVEPFHDAADLVFIGELRTLKGVGTLIEAISGMGRSLSLRIVGSGPDREAFEAMAAKVPDHIRISFLGPMPARRAFALGRMVVMPSYAESLPYVALEAIAAGLPLIATNVGGVSEIFGPDSTSLIAPGNAYILRGAILRALADVAQTKARAVRQREYVRRHFSVKDMVQGINRFYRQVIDAKASDELAGRAASSVSSLAHGGQDRP
ncbi:MAG: glycosyltransferase [Rhizobiales bacterium]|nr:glycosyltransferase [Hyphomicrobiales bacterium]